MQRRKLLSAAGTLFAAPALFAAPTVDPEAKAASDTAGRTPQDPDDVLIIGAGGAGLAAAVSALESGARRVTILERGAFVGGHTVISAGTVTIAAGGETPVEDLARDIIEAGGRPELARTFAENAGAAIQWLGSMGVAWEPRLFRAVGSGMSARRNLSTGSQRGGWDMIQALSERARTLGAKTLFETRACRLLLENGRVGGVAARTASGDEVLRYARAVVLATGGFRGNHELRSRFAPRLDSSYGTTADTFGLTPDLARGDGILMGEAAGAQLVDMDAVECIPYAGGRVLDYAGAEVWINAEGDRFVNEEATFDVIAAAMQEQTGGFMWTITDAKSQKGANFGSKLSAGLVREARSLTALAHDIGISIERLSFTMNSYNRMVALGKDPRFGRTTFLQTIDTPPFYYGIERLCVHITMGGLLIDADARVLDRMNAPVPGLFAAGETTGGVHGRKRLGGNALTDAFVFGRIAGAGAARLALGRCPPGHSIRTGSRAPA